MTDPVTTIQNVVDRYPNVPSEEATEDLVAVRTAVDTTFTWDVAMRAAEAPQTTEPSQFRKDLFCDLALAHASGVETDALLDALDERIDSSG